MGIGVIVLAGGTTAGTVILARIVNKYLDISTPYALLFFDLLVVLISLTQISLDKALVTIISLYIGTKVMEYDRGFKYKESNDYYFEYAR